MTGNSPNPHRCARRLRRISLVLLLSAPHAPAATLLHHWKLDETNGTVAADSAGGAPMSLIGSAAGWTAGGRIDGAYSFNDASYFITPASDTVTDPGPAVAIAGWFRTTTATDNKHADFFGITN